MITKLERTQRTTSQNKDPPGEVCVCVGVGGNKVKHPAPSAHQDGCKTINDTNHYITKPGQNFQT